MREYMAAEGKKGRWWQMVAQSGVAVHGFYRRNRTEFERLSVKLESELAALQRPVISFATRGTEAGTARCSRVVKHEQGSCLRLEANEALSWGPVSGKRDCHTLNSAPSPALTGMEDPAVIKPPEAPWSKLGEYKVIRDIAEGTFGMVKGKSLENVSHWVRALILPVSRGNPYCHRSSCSYEISPKGQHSAWKREIKSAQGSRVHARPQTPAYRQNVRKSAFVLTLLTLSIPMIGTKSSTRQRTSFSYSNSPGVNSLI